jgi:hypothetical protein
MVFSPRKIRIIEAIQKTIPNPKISKKVGCNLLIKAKCITAGPINKPGIAQAKNFSPLFKMSLLVRIFLLKRYLLKRYELCVVG